MAAELLADVDSIKLFVARAAARQSHFKLTAETGPGMGRICCKLDGGRLAIELAAAQTGRLSLHEIEHQLDDSLRLLVGGRRSIERQDTLRATLDWSYALLADPERVAFRRLAAFRGTFDLEAARQVCAGEAGMAALTACCSISWTSRWSSGDRRAGNTLSTARAGAAVRMGATHRAPRSGGTPAASRRVFLRAVRVRIRFAARRRANCQRQLQRTARP